MVGDELQTVQQHAHITHQQLQKPRTYLEVPIQMLIKLKYGSHVSTPAAPPLVKLMLSRCSTSYEGGHGEGIKQYDSQAHIIYRVDICTPVMAANMQTQCIGACAQSMMCSAATQQQPSICASRAHLRAGPDRSVGSAKHK